MAANVKLYVGAALVVLGAGVALATGFNPIASHDAKKKTRTVKATIAGFDENADQELTIDGKDGGSERPDDYAVQSAFEAAFTPIDDCVWNYKEAKGKTEETLNGEVSLAVKLNGPKGNALGVNATLPDALAKEDELSSCVREAAGAVNYPKYDGPPIVVRFEFELDPGYHVE